VVASECDQRQHELEGITPKAAANNVNCQVNSEVKLFQLAIEDTEHQQAA
jgi:hypothetical protein